MGTLIPVKSECSNYVTAEELVRFMIEHSVKGFHYLKPCYRNKVTGEESTDLDDLEEWQKNGAETESFLEAEVH